MEKNTIIPPSAHQPGDHVIFNLGKDGQIRANVVAVKFTFGKVLYDLDLHFNMEHQEEAFMTRIHGVDSAYVKRES